MLAIRYYRQKRGLSQQALADLVGTCQPAVCNIERGRLRPSERLLSSLADALGVSPAFTLLRPVVIQEQTSVVDVQGQVRT